MTSGPGRRRRRARAGTRVLAVVVGVLAVALVVAAGALILRWPAAADRGAAPAPGVSRPATPTVAPSPTPTPTPTLSPAEQLLAQTADPGACAVSFAGEGIDLPPVLEQTGRLFAHLPIPQRDGAVFAGWYPTPADAEATPIPQRVNGADLVACDDRRLLLHGAWKSPDEVRAEDAGIPVLMYHQFTTRPEGEDDWLRANHVYIGDWEEHIAYIAEQRFYLPTWPELDAFIDGRLWLPEHSVIVTDDDADATWQDLAVPIVDRYGVLATSFAITIDGLRPPSPYVLQRSHTHDMHSAGENGKGRMVNWTPEQIAADLEQSAAVLGGAKEVVAYPFGHYDDRTKQGVALAGFALGRTTEQGYVRIGTDKLALPCIRINFGMTVGDLADLIG
ncbi:polysaccharide deacetylase family protein [Microbacterium sp. No. 7]|uniref:polysaccharide deacetylase family protein n=1 Tax=Microbacterium sp. No. 7 TaxID=1714373 RepID=UPI0006D08997|nr:polysaccharide deacetylase family protein [Microbacterium sp. No. 7]ALJ19461.1 xylanase [Microbacterium sp. No. 7]